MGRRREPRAKVTFPVRILGKDAKGHSLLETVTTVNVSRRGVAVRGIDRPMKLGEVVFLKVGPKMVRYRVVRTGEAGTPRAGELVLEKIDLEDLWPMELPGDGPDPYFQPRTRDRRRAGRFTISVPVKIKSSESGPLGAVISDISLTGCYVKALFPLPAQTRVTLEFRLGNQELLLNGTVCNSLRGVGMGIHFLRLSGETAKHLTEYLENNAVPANDRRKRSASNSATESEVGVAEVSKKF